MTFSSLRKTGNGKHIAFEVKVVDNEESFLKVPMKKAKILFVAYEKAFQIMWDTNLHLCDISSTLARYFVLKINANEGIFAPHFRNFRHLRNGLIFFNIKLKHLKSCILPQFWYPNLE